MRRLNLLIHLSRRRVPALGQQRLAHSDPLGGNAPTTRFELR
jgi:hypothetical protein